MNLFEQAKSEIGLLMAPVNAMTDQNDIAKFFQAQGIKAVPGNGQQCAIQEYLTLHLEKKAWWGKDVKTSVSHSSVVLADAIFGNYDMIHHSLATMRFVHAFDHNEHPALIGTPSSVTRREREEAKQKAIVAVRERLAQTVPADENSNIYGAIVSPLAIPDPVGGSVADWFANHPDLIATLKKYDAVVFPDGETIKNVTPKLTSLVNA